MLMNGLRPAQVVYAIDAGMTGQFLGEETNSKAASHSINRQDLSLTCSIGQVAALPARDDSWMRFVVTSFDSGQ